MVSFSSDPEALVADFALKISLDSYANVMEHESRFANNLTDGRRPVR
jgi:hypothetical protein